MDPQASAFGLHDNGARTPTNEQKTIAKDDIPDPPEGKTLTSSRKRQVSRIIVADTPTEKSGQDVIDGSTTLTLQHFRVLMGIPQEIHSDGILAARLQPGSNIRSNSEPLSSTHSHPFVPLTVCPAAPVRRPTYVPRVLQRKSRHDPEAPTSIYYTLMREETRTWRRYYFYDWLVYGSLIVQLILSGVLIILGARNSRHNLAIAIIGAVQGVITGILSILKGNGMPIRLLRYGEGLRKVREKIDWTERELRMGARGVTLADALSLRDMYEAVRDDKMKNHPDVWQGSGGSPIAAGSALPLASGNAQGVHAAVMSTGARSTGAVKR